MGKSGVSLHWGGLDKALGRATGKLGNTQALMESVGEALVSGTKKRFDEKKDPEGTPWKPSRRALEKGGKTLMHSGRLRRQETDQIRKRELYEVELTVNANILADDRAWLERFSYDFVAALSSGGNDSRGNWIRVRASQATFGRAPDKRVGEKVIAVFTRVNRLYVVTFTGRITREEAEELIPSHTINEPTFY